MTAAQVNISQDVTGRRVTVAGAARSGMAAARLLSGRGARVFVTDDAALSEEAKSELRVLDIDFEEGGHTARAVDTDLVVTSPGVPSEADVLARADRSGIPVISELELASWYCPADIVAVTGSNGKTTTTALIGHLIAASGRRTHVAGNIGIPFSDIVSDVDGRDAVVLEVSSFQLEHIHSFRPRVSVLLNITPDHLNRYGGSFDVYAEAKYRITENQGAGGAVVFNLDDPALEARFNHNSSAGEAIRLGFTLADSSLAAGFVSGGRLTLNLNAQEEYLMFTDELPIRGQHNVYNSLAASIAARMMEVGSETVRNSLATFEGIAHRLEFVREVEGVRYINDSKATNVNALWYALESIQTPIVLIAGGRDKGNDYSSVKPLIRDRVRLLIAIGESADKLETELGPHAEQCMKAESLDDAVAYAANLTRPGETVLLSPACASFDMFTNFEQRGDVFKRLIANL